MRVILTSSGLYSETLLHHVISFDLCFYYTFSHFHLLILFSFYNSGKHLLSKEDFEHHKKNCASKEQCEICGQFIHKGGMRKHVHDKHENVRKYQCEKCPYSAKSFKRLKTHQYSHDSKCITRGVRTKKV